MIIKLEVHCQSIGGSQQDRNLVNRAACHNQAKALAIANAIAVAIILTTSETIPHHESYLVKKWVVKKPSIELKFGKCFL